MFIFKKSSRADNSVDTEHKADVNLQELRAKHPNLSVYRTSDGKTAYFKSPTRQILGYASSVSNGDNIAYKQIIAENCFVAGDREILEQDKYFLGLAGKILQLVEIVEGELEKL